MLSGLVRVKGVGPFALIVDSNVMRRGINSRRQLGRILLRHVLMRRVVPVTRGGCRFNNYGRGENVTNLSVNSMRAAQAVYSRPSLFDRINVFSNFVESGVRNGPSQSTIKEGPCRRARLGTVSSPCFGGCFRAFFEYVKSGSYFLSEFLRRSTVVRRGNIRRVEGVCPNKRS